MLIAAPIPREHETPREIIETHIERALRDADAQKISGNAVTPFLLKRLSELTHGESVDTNIALLENNVAVASDIARALARLDETVA